MPRSGDTAAFARIVRLHNEEMTRVAFVIVGDSATAALATEAAWFSAWPGLRRKRTPDALGSWLCSLAAAEATGLARRRDAHGAPVLATLDEPPHRLRPADEALAIALDAAGPGGPCPAGAASCRRPVDGRGQAEPCAAPGRQLTSGSHGSPSTSAAPARPAPTRPTSIACSASASAPSPLARFATSTRTRRRAGPARRSRSSAPGWSRSPSARSRRARRGAPVPGAAALRAIAPTQARHRVRIAMNV